jgi:hypothetical protein
VLLAAVTGKHFKNYLPSARKIIPKLFLKPSPVAAEQARVNLFLNSTHIFKSYLVNCHTFSYYGTLEKKQSNAF